MARLWLGVITNYQRRIGRNLVQNGGCFHDKVVPVVPDVKFSWNVLSENAMVEREEYWSSRAEC